MLRWLIRIRCISVEPRRPLGDSVVVPDQTAGKHFGSLEEINPSALPFIKVDETDIPVVTVKSDTTSRSFLSRIQLNLNVTKSTKVRSFS